MALLKYRIYGLTIASEIPLGTSSCDDASAPDVTVRFGEVPAELPGNVVKGPFFHACHGHYLLDIKDVCRYYVKGGDEVYVAPCRGVTPETIQLFFVGSVMGAVLHQRGYLPLHGSAIRIGDSAVAILGSSGVGKSTLAAALNEAAHDVITDDICAITFDENGRPVLHPGAPRVKLWNDTLEKFDKNPNDLIQVRPELQKFYYPTEQKEIASPLHLSHVFHLVARNGSEFKIVEYSQSNKFSVIKNHTYRPRLVSAFGLEDSHFMLCSKVSNHCSINRLVRPKSGFSTDKLVQMVLNTVRQ